MRGMSHTMTKCCLRRRLHLREVRDQAGRTQGGRGGGELAFEGGRLAGKPRRELPETLGTFCIWLGQ